MNGDRRRASTDWRPVISARTIVVIGVWSLAMVLLSTLTVGIGIMFFAGMGLLYITLITISWRGTKL